MLNSVVVLSYSSPDHLVRNMRSYGRWMYRDALCPKSFAVQGYFNTSGIVASPELRNVAILLIFTLSLVISYNLIVFLFRNQD
jgi:hypothetical protein